MRLIAIDFYPYSSQNNSLNFQASREKYLFSERGTEVVNAICDRSLQHSDGQKAKALCDRLRHLSLNIVTFLALSSTGK